MQNYETERRLREAMDHAAPNDLESVFDAPGRAPEEIIPLRPHRRAPRWLSMAAAAVLALAAFGGFQYWQNGHTVASVVSLDVNPSIQMQINSKEQVLSADPLNKEAWEVLEGMDLQGAPLNVAVNAIVGSLLQHGYFEASGAAILISVEDRDEQRAQRLETSLNASVGAALENAVVHSQVVTYDAGTESVNGLSVGKAALIQDIQAMNRALPFDGLSALTVEELWQLRQSGAPGMPLGLGNAAAAAEKYAGTLALNSTVYEAEPELDETPAHYEVELAVYGLGKFDYKVDAYTGEVLEGVADVLRISAPYDASQNASSEVPAPSATTPTQTTPPASTAPAQTTPPASTAPAQAAPPPSSSSSLIGKEDAKSIAYAHAGVSAANVSGLELELDDGIYELEFYAGTTEYEYEINARDGSVLKAESKQKEIPSYSGYSGSGYVTSGGHHSESHGSHHASARITETAARTAALHHAGISNPVGYSCHNAGDCYQIGFSCNGVCYEYEIDCRTGAVLKAEQAS